MSNDPNIRTTFIPLVLRLTLAAIFIYHGVSKVGDRHNEWGLTWASNMWQKRGEAPKAPLEELDKGIKRLQDDRAALEKKAEDLKKEGNAEKPERNGSRQHLVVRIGCIGRRRRIGRRTLSEHRSGRASTVTEKRGVTHDLHGQFPESDTGSG